MSDGTSAHSESDAFGALRQYQMCVAVLHRELGVEPEEETKRRYQDILRVRLLPPPAAAEPDEFGGDSLTCCEAGTVRDPR